MKTNFETETRIGIQRTDMAPVPLDDLPGDGQTQASSRFLDVLNPEEGSKKSVQFILRKPPVGIVYSQPDGISICG